MKLLFSISNWSHPKKAVVAVVVVEVVVVSVPVGLVVVVGHVVVKIVGHRNLSLKFGQKRVNNK